MCGFEASRAAAETTHDEDDAVVFVVDAEELLSGIDEEDDLFIIVIKLLLNAGEGDRLLLLFKSTFDISIVFVTFAFSIASRPILANTNCSDARGIIHIRARASKAAASSGFSPSGRNRSGLSHRTGTSDSSSLLLLLLLLLFLLLDDNDAELNP